MSEDVLTVSRLNRLIGGALKGSFPDPFWLVGEVVGYDRDAANAGRRNWGQVYFELADKKPGADSVSARISLVAWGEQHGLIRERLSSGRVSLQDGLQVKFLCKMDFYQPWGKLQLQAMDADPAFTLGGLEKARRELLETLKAEGLYDRNRAVPFPPVPLRVGLVTSDGSAAFHDFTHELKGSGYAFRVRLCDARMQGEDTERSVVGALAALGKREDVDVIALVRGGGSRSDLMWFDQGLIARAVASCPKPVVTGIGHEIDLSVTDLVAHASRKTPTAAAQFLVEMVRAFESSFEESAAAVMAAARERLAAETASLSDAVGRWRHAAASRLQSARSDLSESGVSLAAGARRHTSLRRQSLASLLPRLARAALGRLSTSDDRLLSFARELALKDPRRQLARGYSLVTREGRLVKSVAGLSAGGNIEARVSDGTIAAAVTSVRREHEEVG